MSDIHDVNGIKRKRWIAPNEVPAEAQEELESFPPVHRQLLFNRGIRTKAEADEYLGDPDVDGDPFLMKGMKEAVDLILDSIKSKESIIVYGDYDVDGITATALMVQALRALEGRVEPYIPNRFDEGYGLNSEAIQTLKDQGAQLIITVDCGIRSVREAELARKLGIKLIISDHHHVREVVPPANVVICPRQSGDDYPYKELAGVGVAYKIAKALFIQAERDPIEVDQWLDLVALGTVADIAPLTGENRLLVKKGLRTIRQDGSRQGIYSLAGVANVNPKNISASDIGFRLGPRLNAAGRMESAQQALELLLSDNLQFISNAVQELDDKNKERQKETEKNQVFAESQFSDIENSPILITFGRKDEYHEGISGLVAARLTQTHYRPAVVGVTSEETTKASCRSIDEFHITRALDECADLLVRHGGHSKAAGFTVKNENLKQLTERLTQIAARDLHVEELSASIKFDAQLTIENLKKPLMDFLKLLEPTGNENPQPVFVTRNLEVPFKRKIGKEQIHLKMTLRDANRKDIDAVAFNQGFWADQMPEKIDILYHFEINEYNGWASFQLNIKDIRPAEM